MKKSKFDKEIIKITGGQCNTCEYSKIFKKGFDCNLENQPLPIENQKCKKYRFSNKLRITLATKKIRPQFNKSIESILMFAIIEQAIRDFYNTKEPNSPIKNFLTGEMPQAEICDVESKWITDTLIKCGFELNDY